MTRTSPGPALTMDDDGPLAARRRGPARRRPRVPLAALVLPALVGLALVGLAGCDRDPDGSGPEDGPAVPLVSFDTGAVVIEAADTIRLPVELALSDDQWAYGLMERASLPEGQGMLFVYPEPRDSSAVFWMYRTWIPLDIAFLDDEGRILDIQTMEPCVSPNPQVCRRYGPGEPFVAALEMNAGFFASRDIEPGHRIRRVE